MTWSLSRLLGRKSHHRGRRAPIRRPSLQVESLERREVPANLTVNKIDLVGDGGGVLSSVAVGERVNVRVTFNNPGGAFIPAFFSTVKLGTVTKTAFCVAPLGAETATFTVNDFIIKLGSNQFTANLDSTNAVAESSNFDNFKSIFVSAVTFKSVYTGETKFSTPLGGTPNVNWFINNYVDLDWSEDNMLDYKGHTGDAETYDNHNGMDIGPGDGFTSQHNGLPNLAAAGGVVTDVQDGKFDEYTEAKGADADGGYWGNFVEIDHGGGWVTRYLHMRKNTITVQKGDFVNAGDVLGLMGSSGNSTGTHLHFMVEHNGRLIEPYVAPLNYWKNPLPYAKDVGFSNQTYADYHITESASYAKFLVHRGPFDSDTWDFETQDLSATAGDDYGYAAGTVHFGVGNYDQWIEVPIYDDSLREGSETFRVHITPQGSGSSSYQVWTLVDNDHLLNFNSDNGVLTVDAGTDGLDDVVTIDVKGTNVEITSNNITESFPLNGPLAKVTSIVVNTGAGNDLITVLNRPADVALTINAGNDDDVINLNASPGGKAVLMNGGAGDDTFNVGKPKPNYLTMSLNGFAGAIAADGGSGDDTLNVRGNAASDGGRNYTIGSSWVGWGTAEVDYLSMSKINLSTGGGADGIVVATGDVAKKITVDAGGGNDTLTGPSLLGNFWNINAKNAGTINLSAVTFTGVENLTGGSTDDTFKFKSGASLSGNLKGGGGTNGVSYAGLAGPVFVDLQAGTASLVGGKISELATFNGSNSGVDTFYGPNGANLWHVGGNNGLTLNGTTTVWNFENLYGGSGDDTFAFTENGFVSGKVDAKGGNDTLDYSARSSNVYVDLAGMTASATGGIASIEALIGGGGSDTLAGVGYAAGLNLWSITGQNKGTFAGKGNVTFNGVENLKGYSNTDWFIFSDGAGVSGKVDGQGGSDTLNYSAYTTKVTVDLAQQTATGTGKIANIEYFVGGSAGDTFVGPDVANGWKLTGKNSGVVNNTFNFSSFENLGSGAGSDTFTFANGVSLDGSISGGRIANDTLDYSALTTAITVNLATGKATGVAGGVQGILNVLGGAGNDTITGDSQKNMLQGNGGQDLLDGRDGNDLVLGGVGNDNIVGGAGRDLMIGGNGLDVLYGADGEDILIGGSTKHDSNTSVLFAMLTQWEQPEFDYSTRVDMLKNTGVILGQYKLNAANVLNDGIKDTLNGLADSDWFWVLGSGATADQTDNPGAELVN